MMYIRVRRRRYTVGNVNRVRATETTFRETTDNETNQPPLAINTDILGVVRSDEPLLIARWTPELASRVQPVGPIGVHPANPLISGSFLAIFVCWRAKRGTSLATGPDFWEANWKPPPTRPA